MRHLPRAARPLPQLNGRKACFDDSRSPPRSLLLFGLGAGSASAAKYDYLLAPLTQCGGQKQTDTSLPTAEQEVVMR